MNNINKKPDLNFIKDINAIKALNPDINEEKVYNILQRMKEIQQFVDQDAYNALEYPEAVQIMPKIISSINNEPAINNSEGNNDEDNRTDITQDAQNEITTKEKKED